MREVRIREVGRILLQESTASRCRSESRQGYRHVMCATSETYKQWPAKSRPFPLTLCCRDYSVDSICQACFLYTGSGMTLVRREQ